MICSWPVIVLAHAFWSHGIAVQLTKKRMLKSVASQRKSGIPRDLFDSMQKGGKVTLEGAQGMLSEDEFKSYDMNNDSSISPLEWQTVNADLMKDTDELPDEPADDVSGDDEVEDGKYDEETGQANVSVAVDSKAGVMEEEPDADEVGKETDNASEGESAGSMYEAEFDASGAVISSKLKRTLLNNGREVTRMTEPKSHVRTVVAKRENGTSAEYNDEGSVANGTRANTSIRGLIQLCHDNRYFVNLYCWKFCKDTHRHKYGAMCVGDCPNGYNFRGLACHENRRRRWAWKIKFRPKYSRGWGTTPRPILLSGNYGPNIKDDGQKSFALAVVGDPQFGAAGDLVDENRRIVGAVDHIQRNGMTWPSGAGGGKTDGKEVKGVVLPGDLTHNSDKTEWSYFKKVWGDNDNPRDINYKGKVWPMLGNHDYADFLRKRNKDGNIDGRWYMGGEQFWLGHGADGSAQHSMGWMRAVAGGNTWNIYPNWGGADHYDYGSMSYAWSIGKFRFIALQNYPTYKATARQVGEYEEDGSPSVKTHGMLDSLEDGIDFLKEDLKSACDNHQYAVLFFHDYNGHFCRVSQPGVFPRPTDWMNEECQKFIETISGKCVIAVVVGHLHDRVGFHGDTNNAYGINWWRQQIGGVSAENKWGWHPKLLFSGAAGPSEGTPMTGGQGLWLMMKFDESNCKWGWTSMKVNDAYKSHERVHADEVSLDGCSV